MRLDPGDDTSERTTLREEGGAASAGGNHRLQQPASSNHRRSAANRAISALVADLDPLKPKSSRRGKEDRTDECREKPVPLNSHHFIDDTIDFEDIDKESPEEGTTAPPAAITYIHRGAMAPAKTKAGDEDEGEMHARNNKGLIKSLRSYPPAVFFMLGNEFCERFSFYGMRAILTLYLITEHHFSDAKASFFYHAFISLAYFSPLFGSIAADNYFGRFRVILWVSLIYVGGHALLAVGSIPEIHSFVRAVMDSSGLVVIALATGGIKPCVSAFAADQFSEDQHRERTQFFSFFYFAINAGSLLAIGLTPILRGRVRCFGSQYCFPLAFGVPGVLMLIAFVVFLFGWRFYKITPPGKGNVIWKVYKCIGFAAKGKLNAVLRGGEDKKEHWLDYARPQYNDTLIAGVKSLLSVSLLFIPVVLFWALFDQQGSTWVLQARRMDGRVGPFTILPDQMNTLNPLMILLMVPLFEAFLYPWLTKVCRVTPLRKMGAGGILAALSFVIAGLLQLHINSSMEPKPAEGNVFLQRIGNSTERFTANDGPRELLPGRKVEWPAGNYTLAASFGSSHKLDLDADKCGYVISIFSGENGGGSTATVFPYECEKSENGKTRLYLAVAPDSSLIGTQLYVLNHKGEIETKRIIVAGGELDIQPGFFSSPHHTLAYGGCKMHTNAKSVNCTNERDFFAQMGSAYVTNLNDDTPEAEQFTTLVRPNTVNILWQLPQFMVITLGEVLFSITGLEFSYSQAAPTMKSVLQALWLLTTFFGNLIDIGITGTHVISEPAAEFFVYALLMFVVMGVFIWIATQYHYVNERDLEEDKKGDGRRHSREDYDEALRTNHHSSLTKRNNPLTSAPLSAVSPLEEKDSKC